MNIFGKKIKLFIGIENFLLVILIPAFFLVNFFGVRDQLIGVISLIFAVVVIAVNRFRSISLLLLLVLLMDPNSCIGFISIALFIYFLKVLFEKMRVSYFSGLILLCAFLLILQSVWLGGSFPYNIARVFSVIAVLVLPLFLSEFRFAHNKEVGFEIELLYVVCIFTQIACKIFVFHDERISIFNGTENIALVIICCLFLTASLGNSSVFRLVFNALLFLAFVASTASRSAYFIGVLLVGYIFFWKFGRSLIGRLFLFFIGFVLILTISLEYDLIVNNIVFGKIFDVLVNLKIDDIFGTLAVVDVRGALYSEGLNLIFESPILGNGSVSPSVFDERIEGIQDFHNSIIDIFVLVGLLGGFVIVCGYILIFKYLKVWGGNGNAGIVLLVTYFLISLLQPLVFNSQSMLALAFCLYLTSNRKCA